MQPKPQIFRQLNLSTRYPIHGLFKQSIAPQEPWLRRWSHSAINEQQTGSPSASAKLFADAEREEVQETSNAKKASRTAHLEQQHPNWDGDESIQDAVLRMLVDKYKPLRTGTIQSAEEKIRQHPPKMAPAFGPLDLGAPVPSSAFGAQNTQAAAPSVRLEPSTGSWATETLLPSKEGHQPWHTQFKAPSMDSSSVKLAHIPPPILKGKAPAQPENERARRLAREEKKRTLQVNKLAQARESTLDYRLGIKGREAPVGLPNPATMKGWNSLIEDKIEKARKAGMFNTVKGRGKPIQRSMDEYNPFIAREEFLMNRIVQRNNAAPPWVEVQRELDTAVTTFRQILREAWIRRTIRMLTIEHPTEILRHFTLDDIKSHRDSEWIAKEQSYHETAINKLNALVRNYNGLAPYAVRRAYYTRDAEIEKLYKECPPDILQALAERDTEHSTNSFRVGVSTSEGSVSGSRLSDVLHLGRSSAFLNWLRLLFRRLFRLGT